MQNCICVLIFSIFIWSKMSSSSVWSDLCALGPKPTCSVLPVSCSSAGRVLATCSAGTRGSSPDFLQEAGCAVSAPLLHYCENPLDGHQLHCWPPQNTPGSRSLVSSEHCLLRVDQALLVPVNTCSHSPPRPPPPPPTCSQWASEPRLLHQRDNHSWITVPLWLGFCCSCAAAAALNKYVIRSVFHSNRKKRSQRRWWWMDQ